MDMDDIEISKPELDDTKNRSSKRTMEKKRYGSFKIWVGVLVVVGAVIGISAYVATRPEDLELTTAGDSSAPLVVSAVIETEGLVSGRLIVEESSNLMEGENRSFYLNLDALMFPAMTNVTLEFSKNSSNASYVIENVQNLVSPYALPSWFNPLLYTMITFKDEVGEVISNTTMGEGGEEETGVVLTAQLSGSYSISGSITMMNVNRFVGGDVVEETLLSFNDINIGRAPAAFLYLSQDNQFSTSQDLEVPIDGGATKNGKPGFYTVLGDFTQVISPALDLSLYDEGTWFIWCVRFPTIMGRGPISIE